MRKFFTSIFEMLAEKLREKESKVIVLEKDQNGDRHQIKDKKAPKTIRPKEEKNTTSAKSSKNSFSPISPQKMKLISIVGDIRLDPDKTESAFMARQLVQATLPHKNPGDVPSWSRKNGNLTLTLRSGWNVKEDKMIGYPYGTLPRLLLFWIITEAIRTNSPRIELGKSLNQFIKKLGLDKSRGGKRSDAKRLKDQMMRLFRSTISFDQSSNNGRDSWIDMQVAPKGMLCWDERYPGKQALWESNIQLGEDFFNAIRASPVPVDVRALKGLKNSAIALDLYSWVTYTAYQTQKTGRSRCVSWQLLHEQFGAEYRDVNNFAKKAWGALLKIQEVYPALDVERIRGGLKVLPSKPAITVKPKKKKRAAI